MSLLINSATSNKVALCITKKDFDELIASCEDSEMIVKFPHQKATMAGISGAALHRFNTLPRYLLDREVCETDPTYLQLIPYTILYNADDEILIYTRGKKGSEDRLHSLRSIGFGGHIEEATEEPLINLIVRANHRELVEELGLANERCMFSNNDGDPIILLQHEFDEVGKVHMGVVFMGRINKDDIGEEEAGVINELEWIDKDLLIDGYKKGNINLELWSSLFIDAMTSSD